MTSHDAISGLKPDHLWQYFYELSQIPRESGNVTGVQKWLQEFATEHHIRHTSDSVGNIIFYKDATPGHEHAPAVALQGHMDMVCVKKPGSTHDFLHDPIFLVREGDILHAKDTTLGADNGIAVAMILDIFTDDTLVHGPLEAIFTVDEETGLTGAFGLDPTNIHSKMMLNLDSEEEGIIYIGCAGGIEVDADLIQPLQAVPAGWETWALRVDGLSGGHSGAEIHTQRANAIKVAARALHAVGTHCNFMLVSINGGTKRNVIPSTCDVVFATAVADHDCVLQAIKAVTADVQKEHELTDPHANITLTAAQPAKQAFSLQQSKSFIDSLHAAPHGVDKMSLTLKDVVQTSSNLAIVTTEAGHLHVISSHRSSVLSERDDVASRMAAAMTLCGATATFSGAYPSWTPNMESPLAAFCSKAYETSSGKKPVLTAIHAGLECGIINSLIPGMDSVSIGPDMWGVHSTDERISVSSADRTLGFVKELVTSIGS